MSEQFDSKEAKKFLFAKEEHEKEQQENQRKILFNKVTSALKKELLRILC